METYDIKFKDRVLLWNEFAHDPTSQADCVPKQSEFFSIQGNWETVNRGSSSSNQRVGVFFPGEGQHVGDSKASQTNVVITWVNNIETKTIMEKISMG